MRRLGDFGCFLVTNFRIERSNQHQRVVQVRFDCLVVRFNTNSTVVIEAHTSITDEGGTLKHIVRHYWLEYIQLIVSLCATYSYGSLVPHYLSTDHGHRFSLCWVYLTRHDG